MPSEANTAQIRDWSFGRIDRPDLFDGNGRTVRGGLECELVFGPVRDFECHCGRYRGERYRGIVCERCLVEVISSRSRSTRIGHIELSQPVQLEGRAEPVTLLPVLPPALRPSTPGQTHPIAQLYQAVLDGGPPEALAGKLDALIAAITAAGVARFESSMQQALGSTGAIEMLDARLPPVLGLEPFFKATLLVPPGA